MREFCSSLIEHCKTAEKHLFHALRFLHPSKPKPGLPGTPTLRAGLRQQGSTVFQRLYGTTKVVP
jgi:hypothetical protein